MPVYSKLLCSCGSLFGIPMKNPFAIYAHTVLSPAEEEQEELLLASMEEVVLLTPAGGTASCFGVRGWAADFGGGTTLGVRFGGGGTTVGVATLV